MKPIDYAVLKPVIRRNVLTCCGQILCSLKRSKSTGRAIISDDGFDQCFFCCFQGLFCCLQKAELHATNFETYTCLSSHCIIVNFSCARPLICPFHPSSSMSPIPSSSSSFSPSSISTSHSPSPNSPFPSQSQTPQGFEALSTHALPMRHTHILSKTCAPVHTHTHKHRQLHLCTNLPHPFILLHHPFHRCAPIP